MSVSKANIKFSYLYRDAGNNKNFGSVIFANPGRLTTDQLKKKIVTKLIDGEYFDNAVIGVPALFFPVKNADDHSWHEFDNIETTTENPTDKRTIENFVDSLDQSRSRVI